ncbi:MAG: AbrB/MazE/SpoVT family DNA-binding domain-containing protein [Candidatus Anammoxibacter sp.]
MIVKLNPRSIITIPANIRKKLCLKDGDQLDVDIKDGSIVLTPVDIVPRKVVLAASGANKEKTASAQIKNGQTRTFPTARELIEDLHEDR